MKVRSLVEKGADADLLREMIGFVAERLMELDVGGAPPPISNGLRLAKTADLEGAKYNSAKSELEEARKHLRIPTIAARRLSRSPM